MTAFWRNTSQNDEPTNFKECFSRTQTPYRRFLGTHLGKIVTTKIVNSILI